MFLKFNRRGVRVGFALIGGVCVSLPLLKCSAVRAAATELESITLSPQQALALYGTQIIADYYNGSELEQVTLSYIGNTSDLVTLNGYPTDEGQVSYCQSWLCNDSLGFVNQEKFENTPYLIYKWDVSTIASAPNFDFSIRFQHSIDITTYGFQTSVFWSRSTNSVYPGVNASLPYYSSSYTLYGLSNLEVVSRSSFLNRPGIGSEYGIMRTQVLPCRAVGGIIGPDEYLYFFGSQTSCSYLGYSAFAGSSQSGSVSVTVSESEIRFKMERPVIQATQFNGDTQEFSSFSNPAVYFLIQCPTLYGDYILPPPENQVEISLQNIEDYLATQNEDISNISEEATVQTRQLIAILAKLEQIYQKIPSVDLSVPALSTAPSIPIDSELDSRISADLESGAELLPDISESFDTEKMQSFSDLLTRVRSWFPAEIITLGGLSLALAFVTWLLFRGRGS